MSYTINKYHGSYNIVRRSATVKYIVVHYVGAGSAAAGNALANCKYFAGGNRNASAHYFIDNAYIYEYADPSTYATWHCGDGKGKYGITNANSIGIEVCNNGGPYTDAEIDQLHWLVQKLMSQFGVSASNVVRHYDASRKHCPAYYVDNTAAWHELHSLITSSYEEDDMFTDEDRAKLNETYNQVTRTDDITGRGYKLNDHDHIKWIAKGTSDTGAKADKILEALTNLQTAVSDLTKALTTESKTEE